MAAERLDHPLTPVQIGADTLSSFQARGLHQSSAAGRRPRQARPGRSLLALGLGMALCMQAGPASALEFQLTDQGYLGDDFANLVQNEESYAVDFINLTAHGMVEQAFTLQANGVQGSAALPGPAGFQLGLELVTFPLKAPTQNLLGKTENTGFSPVLPKLAIGYARGDLNRDTLAFSGGYSLVPPITVEGANALVHGLELSVGYNYSPKVKLGLEADVSFGRAIAPVTVPKDQYEASQAADPSDPIADDFANVDPERYAEVCEPQEFGCLDTLGILHGTLRAIATFPISAVAQPYVRLGVQGIHDTFDVEIDGSKYLLSGLMPQVGVGANLTLNPHLRAGVGALAAYATPVTAKDPGAFLFRFELGASWVL